MKRFLIVTADDYGFSAERNKGIIDAFKRGAVKSASLLLNCTGSEEGPRLAKSHGMCLGLHLNLTEGVKVSTSNFKTLTTDQDEFHGMLPTPKLLEAGQIDINEISTEIKSQLQRFQEVVGDAALYVDGHQHIHVHPEVAETFAAALKDNGITITRFPIEVNMAAKSWVNPDLMPFFNEMIRKAEMVKPILDKYGIKYPDSYAGLSTMGADMTVDHLQQILLEAFETAEQKESIKTKGYVTCELMTHPGFPTSREFGGFSWGTDDFGASEERVHEIEVLSSSEMMEFYQKNNIQLVSHKILLEF